MSTTTRTDPQVVIDLRQEEPPTSVAPISQRRQLTWLTALGGSFVLAEVLVALSLPAGALAHAALCLVALALCIRKRGFAADVSLTFGALSSVRLFTISLPIAGVSTPTRAAIIGAVTVLVYSRATRALGPLSESRPAGNAIVDRFFTILLGAAAVGAAYLYAIATQPPVLTILQYGLTHTIAVVVAVLGLSLAAAGEELLFRGLFFRTASTSLKMATPVVASLLWAATYFGLENLVAVAIVFVTGLAFGFARMRGISMQSLIVAHAVVNVGALMVLPSLI